MGKIRLDPRKGTGNLQGFQRQGVCHAAHSVAGHFTPGMWVSFNLWLRSHVTMQHLIFQAEQNFTANTLHLYLQEREAAS
jgi:hypothetical protein